MNNYSIKYKSASVDVDISSYVTDIGDVPYLVRNPDFTIVADGYDMKMSSTYTGITNIEENVSVLVYSGSVLIHNGKVEDKTYDYGKREYKIKVRNALTDLQDVENSRRRMGNIYNHYTQSVNFTYTFQEEPPLSQNHNLILHNDIIRACFSASGYSLDWTQYYETRSLNMYATYGFGTAQQGGIFYPTASWEYVMVNTEPENVWYLPGAIYCLNQPKVWSPQWLEYNNGDINNKLSCFVLIISFNDASKTEFKT
jgi:hypothetical protein